MEVEVISGIEEARLIHLGVLQAVPVYDQRLLLCDIGGGSTELLVGQGATVALARSLKLGAIRLTERFFPEGRTDRQTGRPLPRATSSPSWPRRPGKCADTGFDVAVGSSGTIRNIGGDGAMPDGRPPPRSINSATSPGRDLDEVSQQSLAGRHARAGARSCPGSSPAGPTSSSAGARAARGRSSTSSASTP